jgi:pimeloyl-ACP methyl ester carboxylesterase
LGPFVREPQSSPLKALMMRAMLMKPWGPLAWRAYLRSAFPGRKHVEAQLEPELTASLRRGDHWRSFVATTRTAHDPAERVIDSVGAPALVVMGAADPDWPDPAAEATWAAERLNAELVIVPDAGHYPMTEYPEIVNPALRAFADKVFARA